MRSPYDFISLLSTHQRIRDLRNSVHFTTNDSMRLVSYIRVFGGFGLSQRTCYRPVDYVYGVSGILGWDIPRMADPDIVWGKFISYMQLFAKMLHENLAEHNQENVQINVSVKAHSFSLSAANNLGEVFRSLLHVKLQCTCTTCIACKHMLKFDPE